MTPGDFKILERYHRAMIAHHTKMLKGYMAERKKIEINHARAASKRITNDILGKLSEQKSSE